ncbi:MAG: hydantoinase B/oxoprolinase family protein [Planctomycetes bacterium]|nr:hydantoinase B/oxoprolinase family protein [Planctomycetota bacterium]
MKRSLEALDPVRLRIYENLFSAIAEEMGGALGRLGFSPNITERRDYSTALFAADGSLAAQAAHIPVHLGSMPLSVECAIAALRLGPGDVGLLNDPFQGGTHLPDITLVAPVFLPGDRDRPSFFVANRAHHADVGGIAGGSMAAAREIYQEGLRIPPVIYARGGKVDEGLHRLFLANMRGPAEREGDLAAQLAALRVGERRLRELVEANGRREVLAFAKHLQRYAERLMRAALAAIPAGRYAFEDFLDAEEAGCAPPKIRAAISIRGGRAAVDFAGTSPPVPGNRNANLAVTLSAVFYVFRALGGEAMPANAGCLKPVEVRAPRGTLVNALAPAAVAAGNVETSQRIVDVLLGALAKALPDKVPAASQGTMNNLTIAGYDPVRRRPFTYYETLGGGTGALRGMGGVSGIHSHMTNTWNTPIEALESSYPIKVTAYALRRGSGGRGRWKGGDGLTRELELLAPAEVAFTGESRERRPYGLGGGGPGAPGRAWLIFKGKKEALPGRFHRHLPQGARISIETPGGGGFGKPKREKHP